MKRTSSNQAASGHTVNSSETGHSGISEAYQNYLARGGKIRQLKPGVRKSTGRYSRPITFTAVHHRFPRTDSLAIANERRRLRKMEEGGG